MAMTRAMQAGIYADKIDQAAAQSLDPLGKARALQVSGNLRTQVVAPAIQQNAMMSALSQASKSGNPDQMLNTLRVIAPDRAKEMESRYVPSLGAFADRPIDAKDRESMVKLDDLDKKLSDAISYHSKVSGTLGALSPKNQAVSQAKTNDLITSVNDLKNLNRFTGEEGTLYSGIVGKIGGFDPTGATGEKLQMMRRNLQNKRAILNKSYSLPVPPTFNQK
jgi:hypothetical protein